MLRAIRLLEDDPRHPGVVKMAGPEDLYRVRVGDWRIVYAIQNRELVMIVIRTIALTGMDPPVLIRMDPGCGWTSG
jgi:mRNA interferase RelE/StbE